MSRPTYLLAFQTGELSKGRLQQCSPGILLGQWVVARPCEERGVCVGEGEGFKELARERK